MKNTILLTFSILILAGLALLVQAEERPDKSQLSPATAGDVAREEKGLLAEDAAGLAYYGRVAEQVFTLQTGAEPFEKLKEALLNL